MADAMSDDLYDEPVDDEPEGEDADVEGDGIDDEVGDQARDYVDDDDDDDDDDDEAKASDDDDEDEEKPKKREPKSRYEKHLQQVIKQRKEEAGRNAELAQRVQRYEQQQARFEQTSNERMRVQQEDRERLISAEKELELLRRQRELSEEEGLDPAERLKRQAIREANELNRQERDVELAAIRKDHEDFKAQLARERNAAAREQRINGYDQQASYATASLLEEFPSELAEKMYDKTKTMVLNWGAAHGYRDLRDAARDFKDFAMKYALAEMKLKGRARGEQRQKGKKVPSASPTSKRTVKGRPVPTMDQARKKGHEDVLDAMRSSRGE